MNGILDYLKAQFLNNASQVSVQEIIVTLALTFGLSVYIFFMYKANSRSVLYSRSFNITMAAMAVITAIVVMAIKGSIVLSLGMVGALSIVRFRTAVKDPVDLLFIFWSITVGITMGAGMYPLAFIGSVVVAIVLLVLNFLPMGGTSFLLVYNCRDDESAAAAREVVAAAVKKLKLKSRSVTADGIEFTYEVALKDAEGAFVSALKTADGVTYAALVAYDGEFVA